MTKRTCSIDGCDKAVVARGLCGRDYQRWRAKRPPDWSEPPREKPGCSIGDCGRQARAKGYCNRHYENLRRYGDPVPQRDKSLEDRLREIGWSITESGCWEWDGKRNDRGYGIFDAKRLGYVGARAHRVMYACFVGPLDDEAKLRHTCDNPPCVNPAHLLPGTPADNIRDMVERGRHWRHGRTQCDAGHDLTLPGARTSRGWCLKCDRARKRRYEQRQRDLAWVG